VDNHGFELVLNHRNTVGDLVYSVIANTSFARSEIIFMDEVPPAEPYQTETGHPVGSGLYYKSDGIFNTQEELNSYPHASGTQVGDIKIVDLNNDGVIDAADQYLTNNSPIPEYVFGLTANFQYKGFDLTLFFQGQTNAYSYDFTLTEIVQQPFLEDGTVNPASGYDPQNPYQDRDPRFDATIVHDGTVFRGDTYEMWIAEDGSQWGYDSYKNTGDNPRTNYVLKKFMIFIKKSLPLSYWAAPCFKCCECFI